MIKFVNAKLNLGLNILRKREDGYHDLATVFFPVGLHNGTPVNPEPFCDILEINLRRDSSKDLYSFSGNCLDCSLEKNLVFKAVNCFKKEYQKRKGEIPFFEVSLDKHIPDGAGLGGGSADAAFSLRMANELCGNILTKNELFKLAASLGADCAFFIENSPVFATGIGDKLRPANVDLSGYWVVIVKPDIYVSTKEAFAGIVPEESDILLETILEHPIERWETEGLRNDFEHHIFSKYPQLKDIKIKLKKMGASYSAMSGSGSSIFGIFSNKTEALKAYMEFKPLSYLSLL